MTEESAVASGEMAAHRQRAAVLTDSFARRIDYLRLSVTDRCNLRCLYCLPESYSRFTPAAELLTDDEIVRLVSCFAQVGVSKLRITGGEPLVRPGLPELVARLSALEGISDIALSTNGVLLEAAAADLAQAGLDRVNISLDSLRPDKFRRITRFGRLDDVLRGIDAALAVGLSPVKLNVVVAKGLNDDEIGAFAKLTESRPLHVRFIELMPMGETGFFSSQRWMRLSEIRDRAAPLTPLPEHLRPLGHGPARYLRRPGAKGAVGFISALSCGFCSSCNRLRLTARGVLMPCLDGCEGENLLPLLREGASHDHMRQLITQVVRNKPESHSMWERARTSSSNPRLMCQVGG